MMDETLGQKLKRLRKDRSLSQYQVAKRLGVSRSAVSAYESDRSDPPYDTLKGFADIYKVSVEYLLGFNNNQGLSMDGLTDHEQFIIKSLIAIIREKNKF